MLNTDPLIKSFLFPVITFILLIFSCAANAQESITDNSPNWLSLDIVGINGMIQVPRDVQLIRDDPGFHLGDGKDFYMEIIHSKETFGKTTSAVEQDSVRKFIKYVQDDFSGFIAEVKVNGKTEYDFYYFIRIGKERYILKDSAKFRHTGLEAIQAMYRAAKTMKAKYFIYN